MKRVICKREAAERQSQLQREQMAQMPSRATSPRYLRVHAICTPMRAQPDASRRQSHSACAFRLGKEIAVNQWQQRRGLEARRGESLMGKADVAQVIAEGRRAWGQGLAAAMLIQLERAETLGR